MNLHSPVYQSNPLVPLHAIRSTGNPVFCIPGAGASVTTFVEFINALGEQWPIHGLQSRGIDIAERPHESVEDAAIYNLCALDGISPKRPAHLLGHSHGGLVAFDMALRLYQRSHPVASLTLIDTDPPDSLDDAPHQVSTAKILREFVEVFEDTFDKPLDIHQEIIASGQTQLFIDDFYEALVRAGIFFSRNNIAMLRGSLATFTAACRCKYVPSARYPGKVNLVLVGSHPRRRLTMEDDRKRLETHAARWRCHAHELNVWHGAGHHFSILQTPQVHGFAKWWRQTVAAVPV